MASCGYTAAVPTPAPSPTASSDLLAAIRTRGVLRIATDANYPPQSFRNADGTWTGFDIEVGREIARRLGVEPEFLDISFDLIVQGGWHNRWDIHVGSMTITAERRHALLFTEPYYYTPAIFAVHASSAAHAPADLAGGSVGVGIATTYEAYLQGNLTLEGESILVQPPSVTIQHYDTDLLALQDLALGDGVHLKAALTALPTVDKAIKEGLALRVLGTPVFYEALAVALDKQNAFDSAPLVAAISGQIAAMRADGTLSKLSVNAYGVDLAVKTR
jgi:polar amino acid transport system substrate-binding protein